MPHLKHIDEYLKHSGLDAAGQVGIAMIAAVAAVQRYAAVGQIANKRDRSAVITSAASDFYKKLRRYL